MLMNVVNNAAQMLVNLVNNVGPFSCFKPVPPVLVLTPSFHPVPLHLLQVVLSPFCLRPECEDAIKKDSQK